MLNSRQRAQLRGMANEMETILQVGKGGITENTIKQVKDALEARELIKLRILETCPTTVRETADELALKTDSDVVQVIGYRFILYKESVNNKTIELVEYYRVKQKFYQQNYHFVMQKAFHNDQYEKD